MPRSRVRQWSSVLASAGLGVAAAFALQAFRAGAALPPAPEPPPPPLVRPAASAPAPRITLPEAQALRDAAEALTPAGVALDEQAHATWLPRLGALEDAASDPRLPPETRDELHAALTALARVGLAPKAP